MVDEPEEKAEPSELSVLPDVPQAGETVVLSDQPWSAVADFQGNTSAVACKLSELRESSRISFESDCIDLVPPIFEYRFSRSRVGLHREFKPPDPEDLPWWRGLLAWARSLARHASAAGLYRE